MMDRILGFAGGSVSGFVAWITGFVNLQNVVEVLIITLIGGIGGVLGNWIGQAIIRKCSKSGRNKNLGIIIILISFFACSGIHAQSYQVIWEQENQQVFIHGQITLNQLVAEFQNCNIPGKNEFHVMPYMPLDNGHPNKGLYIVRMTQRIWTYGEMNVGEYLAFADTVRILIKHWYVSPIYK